VPCPSPATQGCYHRAPAIETVLERHEARSPLTARAGRPVDRDLSPPNGHVHPLAVAQRRRVGCNVVLGAELLSHCGGKPWSKL
jgi:hypothetical protein